MFYLDLYITYAIFCLTALLLLLTIALYGVSFRTVRIYNWDGSRYCYLGRAGVRHNGGGFQVHIGEWMADLSHTTLYQICPSRQFVRKNKYAEMMLSAGNTQCLLYVDSCMRQSVYYR